MALRLLIVDDEKEIADLLELYLSGEGYEIEKFYDARQALARIGEQPPDLALLDVMMPELDGFSLCRLVREKYTFPIIMVTAKGEDIDKIGGLAIGADDYIVKPFNPLEVVARVKAQLRRAHRYSEHADDEVIDFSGLVINHQTHECTLYERKLPLTPIEFDILWLLCRNRGKVLSSEEIFEQVWGEKYLDCNNTVMVHIRRLREKMGERPREPKFIKTVWGVGYKIDG